MTFLQRLKFALRPGPARRKRLSAITAANRAGGNRGGWPGVQSYRNEDALNKDVAFASGAVIQRSQDLDINNPDIGGFNRTRVAQILGKGVRFKHVPHATEIGIKPEEATEIARQVNRLREIHSRLGGFDASGKRRSEGKQQERAFLTAIINGSCLIHRVWNPSNPVLPLSLELIPGVRISTPYAKAGDPHVSYGFVYSDPNRTELIGFWVRRVSKTIGDSFVPDYEWDYLPIEDCSLLEMTEQAGIDRAMPLSVRVARMARNRGEFLESSVESARAQADHYAVIETAEGQDPYSEAAGDSDYVDDRGQGFTSLGDGVKAFYTQQGEKVQWSASRLPDPDFTGFMDKTDERMARGLGSSLSRFTRHVNSSWAGGRLEDQQDDPIVDQYRDSFVSAWQKVNEWFIEAVWLSDAIELPGYSEATRPYWSEFRATFPGKVHINESETMTAREKSYMLRTGTPQQGCEQDGFDLRENLRQWAEFYKMRDEIAAEYKIEPTQLDILFSGRAVSSSAGAEIGAPEADAEDQPADDSPNRKTNGQHLNPDMLRNVLHQLELAGPGVCRG